jgi:hypothetical protein
MFARTDGTVSAGDVKLAPGDAAHPMRDLAPALSLRVDSGALLDVVSLNVSLLRGVSRARKLRELRCDRSVPWLEPGRVLPMVRAA